MEPVVWTTLGTKCGRCHNWVGIPGRPPYVIPRWSAGWTKNMPHTATKLFWSDLKIIPNIFYNPAWIKKKKKMINWYFPKNDGVFDMHLAINSIYISGTWYVLSVANTIDWWTFNLFKHHIEYSSTIVFVMCTHVQSTRRYYTRYQWTTFFFHLGS